jgi:putative component of membrane protein insertase Oxa1/YidC/SpoIIIJ protein YidD
MIDSINKSGVVRGVFNGIKRILRCHPFSKNSGWDPA